jgi:hypothetical protein
MEGLTPVYMVGGVIYRTTDVVPEVNAAASGYRLPTEAEWEWAARGGALTHGYTYSGSNTIEEVAWYDANSGGGTQAVGTKAANELGLYDMSGNLFEWCWYVNGSYRRIRGGGHSHIANFCAVYDRNWSDYVNYRSGETGFRTVSNFIRTIPATTFGGGYSFANFAGAPGDFTGSADGTGNGTSFSSPSGVVVDASGNIYVSDSANHTIRKVTSSGVVTTLAGKAGFTGSADGTGIAASFSNPQGMARDAAGNIYVAEFDNHRIRKVTSAGVVTQYAGKAGFSGSADGTGTAVRFNQPADVAVDSAGNVYVADSGNHAIRKITKSGSVTTLAGTMGSKGSANGTGAAARFASPQGVAVDATGNVYVADTANCLIRKVTASGSVTTFAGAAFTGGADRPGRANLSGSADFSGQPSVDGIGAAASFSFPTDIEVDSAGNLYVTDSGSGNIRKITSGGVVTTLGGTPAGFFYNPMDIAVDSTGKLYVADAGNNRIARGIASAEPLALPHITTQPASLAEYHGTTVTFGVIATGSALKYQWYFNDKAIARATGLTYSVKAAATAAGNYKVVVSNTLGSETSNTATLTLRPNASWNWSAASTNQTVSASTPVTFGVENVTGPGVITYQWLKDGKTIAGATARELSIGQASLSNAGLYSLAITTSAGKVTTDPLRLIVSDPGLLIFGINGTGTAAVSAGKTSLAFKGMVVMDCTAQRGAIIWFDDKAKTYSVEMREDLSSHSTGPSVGTTTVFSAVAVTGTHPDVEQEFIWVTGTDALIALDATKKTMVPAALTGQLNSLTLAGGTAIQIQNATLTLDKVQTLKARSTTPAEDLEAAIARISAEGMSKGYSELK